MIFNNKDFNAMQSSVDALWMKQKVIAQNISNYETSNYKAKSVRFEDVLSGAKEQNQYKFRATVVTDESTEMRPDGNNVNMEKESLELYRTYLQSAFLSTKISGEISTMRYVLNQAFK